MPPVPGAPLTVPLTLVERRPSPPFPSSLKLMTSADAGEPIPSVRTPAATMVCKYLVFVFMGRDISLSWIRGRKLAVSRRLE